MSNRVETFATEAEAELRALEHPGAQVTKSPRGNRWAVSYPDPTADAIDAIMADKRAHRPVAAPSEIAVTTLPADLMAHTFPPYRYAWGRYYPLRATSALIAEGKVGKSTLSLAQQLHGAAGKDYLGAPTLKGLYVYISCEDDTDIVFRRAQKILTTFSAEERAKVEQNFKLIDGVGKGLQFVMCSDGLTGIAPTVDRIIEAVKAISAGRQIVHVACDTVSRLNGGQENDSQVMSAVEQAGSRIAQALDCAVSLLHHTSKAVAREGIADSHAGRGSASFGDNCRSVLRLMPLTWAMVQTAKFDGLDRLEVERGDVLKLVHAALNQDRKSDPLYMKRTASGLLERIELTARTEKETTEDEMRNLVRWFKTKYAGMPFTVTHAARTARLEWTRMTKSAATAFLEDAVCGGLLVKRDEYKGSALYAPSLDLIQVLELENEGWDAT